MVICRICNKQFKRVTHKHLKHHDLTLDEYKERYPNDALISEEVRDKLRTNTLQHFQTKHGSEEGAIKYTQYKQRQAYTNTYEYKHKHHGWTKKQFDDYNQSRASTKENFILRHGEEQGSIKWNEYVELQKHAGVSLEYFIEKYGRDAGTVKYMELGGKKAHTVENYMKWYGMDEEAAIDKLNAKLVSLNTYSNFCSKTQNQLFTDLAVYYPSLISKVTCGKEFSIWSPELSSICFYDGVIEEKQVCIEFNGDYWHCNPVKYNKHFFHPNIKKTAAEIWDRDRAKMKAAKDRGFQVKVVWESQYKKHNQQTIQDLCEWIELQ